MKWVKNLENIIKNNTPGKCPCCGSTDTDYNTVKVVDNYGYGVIWCNKCKNAYNISRLKITNNMITNHKIPTDLRF